MPATSISKAAGERMEVYRNGFEDGEYQGITGRGTASLEVSTSEHQGVGNNSLSISGRTATWHGIELPISSMVQVGESYDFCAYVKQDTGEDQTIAMKLQYTDAEGTTQYKSVIAGVQDGFSCKSGEWTELKGSYVIPESQGGINLYWECDSSATADFLIDNISIFGLAVEKTTFSPDAATYEKMVKGGVTSTGNNARIKEVIKKAREGQNVSLAYIGGSITEGGGYNPNSACYAEVSANLFRTTFGKDDGANVHFINAGMSGTPSDIGIVRYERDVINRLPEGSDHPDILFIEFAVNDSGCETGGAAYEGLIRQALKSGSAVVLIFSVFYEGMNRVCENDYRKYGKAYDLPMISTGDAIKDVYGQVGFYEWFYNDKLHPNAKGYKLMADCILQLMKDIDKEEAETDNITDVDSIKAVKSDAYTDFKMIDSKTSAADIPEIGSITAGDFGSKDSSIPTFQYVYNGKQGAGWFPDNWMHNKNAGGEIFTMDINCQTLLLVYKESSQSEYGSANLYVDGKKKKELKCYNTSGWNNGKVCIAIAEKTSSTHRVELKMKEGDEKKKFTLYAMGYKSDGKAATEYAPPTPTPVPIPTPVPTSTVAPTAVPTVTPLPPSSPNTNPNKETDKKVTAPGKAKITSAKAKKKKATVKWGKVKDAAGYQLEYSTSKNFKKKSTITTKKVSVTIKKLKSKKYYVRVRAYKLDGKKKVPGKWSAVKQFRA